MVKGDEKETDAAKKVKPRLPIKSSQKGDQKDSVKEGYTDDEIRELCHSKDHDCATVVEHPIWGLGKPIEKSHAIPDDNGFVAWYDVQFKHGVEEKVMAEDVKVLKNAHHGKEEGNMPKTKTDAINAMNDMMKKMSAAETKELVASYMAKGKETDEEVELKGLQKAKQSKRDLHQSMLRKMLTPLYKVKTFQKSSNKLQQFWSTAVKSKIRPEVERIEEEKFKKLQRKWKHSKLNLQKR